MASKGTKLTDKEKKAIIAHYTNEHTMEECATKFNRSISTVKKTIDEANEGKFGDFAKKVEEVKNKNTKEILDFLKDNRISDIIDKMLILMDDEVALEKILAKEGIRPFTQFIGMNLDKALKYKQITEDVNINHDITVQGTKLKEALANSIGIDNPLSLIEEDSVRKD